MSRRRVVSAGLAAACAVIGLAGLVACDGPAAAPPCQRDIEAEAWARALPSCERALADRREPKAGFHLALAHLNQGRLDDAARVARSAPLRHADASWVLGQVALAQGRLHEAMAQLMLALSQHAIAGDDRGVARDAHGLAGAFWKAGQLDPALAVLALGEAAAATRARMPRMLAFVKLAEADVLRVIGDHETAERRLDEALLIADSDADRAWILLKRGVLYGELGDRALAEEALRAVVRLEQASTRARRPIVTAARLNLAWLARLGGRLAESLTYIEIVALDDPGALQVRLNRGLALADAGRSAAAAIQLEAAEAAGPTGDWAWWVPYRRGQVAEALADLDGAERAYRRAIDAVGALRAAAGTREATVIASHRQPYQALIGLCARQGRWRDALAVVAGLEVGALLGSMASPMDMAPSRSERPKTAAPSLPAPISGGAGSPPSEPAVGREEAAPDPDAIARAWRGRRLRIVVVGGERMWGLDVVDGAVTGRDLGEARALEAMAQRLERQPDDALTANALGAALLGTAHRAPLALLLVGPVSRAPLAALQVGGRSVLDSPPVVRVLGVLPRAAAPFAAADASDAVVLGDPTGALPAARDEARLAHARVGGRLRTGRDATRAALREAAGASFLHLAGHSEHGAGGSVLPLADGDVRSADIAALVPAPRTVVLATCGAAAARDEIGWGSMAAAFLSAGADHVIASAWSIGDEAARRLVVAFYDEGGASDPVGALWRAQRALRGQVPALAWAGFTVLAGPPVAD